MESELRNYLDGGRYYKRRVPAPLTGLEAKVQFRAAVDGENECALLALRWRVHHPGDTAARAFQLVDRYPNSPRPHELLAAIALADGDPLSARDHSLRAVARQSSDPFVYIQLAREAMSAYVGADCVDLRVPDELAAQLRGWLDRALALAPDNHEVLTALAMVEGLAAEPRITISNRVQAALPQMREPGRALLGLALIRWHKDDVKTCAQMLDALADMDRTDMTTRSAANTLRMRLPDPTVAAAPDAAKADAAKTDDVAAPHRGAVDFKAKPSTASMLLDQLLAERGSTARPVSLPPVTVVRPGAATADAWQRVADARQRAAAGDAQAMLEVAWAHATGRGGEFSAALALAWLQKSADAGCVLAVQISLQSRDDVAGACRLLRENLPEKTAEPLPPLEEDLAALIVAAKSRGAQPLTALYRAPARYPDERGVPGDVTVQFMVDASGRPVEVQAARASDPVFAAAAEACIRQWRFLPTIRDREPRAALAEVAFHFEGAPRTAGAP